MADNRRYFVICEDNCKFESMTKEQILAAITQAVEEGEIHDVDTGFVTKIREQNLGKELKLWIGTQAQYNALEQPEEDTLYMISDPTLETDLQAQIDNLQSSIAALQSGMIQTDVWQWTAEDVANCREHVNNGWTPVDTSHINFFENADVIRFVGNASGEKVFVRNGKRFYAYAKTTGVSSLAGYNEIGFISSLFFSASDNKVVESLTFLEKIDDAYTDVQPLVTVADSRATLTAYKLP